MQLEVTDYQSMTRWRWKLSDENGNYIADHEVDLDQVLARDPNQIEYEGYLDPPAYLRAHREAYGRGRAGDDELIRLLGAWIGEQVFGPLRDTFRANITQPATVIRVIVPPEAQDLLFRPFELAHLDGRPLVDFGIRFIYQQPNGAAAPPPKPTGPVLRVLAVFSLPTDANPLNLRRERHELRKLLLTIARTHGVAIEPRILQYGATRAILKEALQEAEGWDVIHLSCHGGKGSLLLETDQGETDEIDAEALHELMLPAKAHLRLLTLSACWSGAASHEAARHMLGLDDEPTRQDETGEKTEFPSLGQNLSRALDCAVLAMRFPVGDKFAADLALALYEHLLDKHQPLPAALRLAVQDATRPDAARFVPSLSVVTPILFGPRAADATLVPPKQPPAFELPSTGLFGFPPESEHFVGRLMPMLRAGQACAPGSSQRGVLFHGMAGGGKTACAVELAHRYDPRAGGRRRFQGFVFHKCPDEGSEIVTALVDCLHDVERQLNIPPGTLTALTDKPEDFRESLLPRLRQLLGDNAVLIVIDNIESLLTRAGDWRDEKWGLLLDALLGHDGDSRIVLTSRRLPNTLANHAALLRETIHALSFAESVLLARELPHLREYFESEQDRDLLTQALRVIQGHPKLLELADKLASQRERFAEQVARSRRDAEKQGAPLKAFFDVGESGQGADDFVATLTNWTLALSALLPPTARLLFHFLCRLEDEDRVCNIIEANWKDFLTRFKDDHAAAATALDEPGHALSDTLDRLTACGLVAARTVPIQDGTVTLYVIHPGVAEAGRSEADPKLLAAADTKLADFHLAYYQHGHETETEGGGPLVIAAARRAPPYLMRAKRWTEASTLLERLLHRDESPATLNWAIPLLRRILKTGRGTEREGLSTGILANALRAAGRFDEAKTMLRELVTQSEAREDFRTAAAASGDLMNVLLVTGRLNDALGIVERKIEFTRKAGLGPWTQLSDEVRRLQVLAEMGRYTEVLEAVETHRKRLETLPENSEQDESTPAFNVREAMLSAGQTAAIHLSQWRTALRLSAERVKSKRRRRANELEIARALFSDYGPLLHLGRHDDCRKLLNGCRDVFDCERHYSLLGKVYGALAELEGSQQRRDAAVSLAKAALKYCYQSFDPEASGIGHHNLSNYLRRADEPREQWLAHRLAAGLIRVQTGSGTLQTTLRNLALSELPPASPSFGAVVAEVERIEGVRFREHFERLPQRFPDGDAALAAIWQMALQQEQRMAKQEAEKQATLASLPADVQKAFDLGGKDFSDALKTALDALPPQEREKTLQQLRDAGLTGGGPDVPELLAGFDPLLRAVAAVARGEGTDEERANARSQIEEALKKLEEQGWQLTAVVQRIWSGERDADVLTTDLAEQDAALVQHILELLADPPPPLNP